LGRPAKSAGAETAKPSSFRTDDGRPVTGGGGVTPDVAVTPLTMDPWESFLDQRGLFTSFASEYLATHAKVEKTFDPDQKLMEDFKDYLHRQGILTPAKYWGKDQSLLKTRIKTEIINLVFGLDMGNQIQARSDPQVQKAVSLLPRLSILLTGPAQRVAQRGGGF
ncbi:MAG: hypothetical protein ACRD3T_03300, partial [Terriglobia bacterium]